MHTAWKLASFQSTTDVKELIPEFFFLPEFLQNSEGTKHMSLNLILSVQHLYEVGVGKTPSTRPLGYGHSKRRESEIKKSKIYIQKKKKREKKRNKGMDPFSHC